MIKWLIIMKRQKFPSSKERAVLHGVMSKRKADGLEVRRANALLLYEGKSTSYVAEALYLNAETVREWRRMFVANGMSWLPKSA